MPRPAAGSAAAGRAASSSDVATRHAPAADDAVVLEALAPLARRDVLRAVAATRLDDGRRLADLPPGLAEDVRRDLTAWIVREVVSAVAQRLHERRIEAARGRVVTEGLAPVAVSDVWCTIIDEAQAGGLGGVLGPGRGVGAKRALGMLTRRASFLAGALNDLCGAGPDITSLGWSATTLEHVRLADTGSDPHNGQATVLVFSHHDERVVYKPRRIDADLLVHELLGIIEWHAGRQLFRLPKCVGSADHGWFEYVSACPLQSSDDRRRYLRNFGHLLGAAWVLRITDLHAENLVSVGSWPVLIDAETLLQPALCTASDRTLGGGDDAFSVLDTLLLPDVEGGEARRWDSSGLAGTTGAATDAPQLRVVDAGCDRMTTVWGRQRLGKFSIHAGVLRDAAGDARLVADGFAAAVTAAARASRAIAARLACAGDTPRRVIVRSTAAYDRVLTRARSPSLWISGTELSTACDVGVSPIADGLASARRLVADAERAHLLHGDVPRFEAGLVDDAIATPAGAARGTLDAPEPASDVSDARRDQERAVTVAAIRVGAARLGNPPANLPSSAGPSSASILDSIRSTVKVMRDEGLLPAASDGPWYGLQVDPYPRMRRLGSGLHHGTLGVAVTLAAVARVVPEERDWVDDLLRGQFARLLRSHADDLVGIPGALDGHASALHAVDLIEAIRPGMVPGLVVSRLVHATASELDRALAGNEICDVATGLAGSMSALLNHVEPRGPGPLIKRTVAALLASQQAGGGWLDDRQRQLCGVAHGAAGIAAVLARAAAILPEHGDRIAQAARAACAMEARAWCAGDERWRDLRFNHRSQDGALNAWCHGAAGILRARLETGSMCPDLAEVVTTDVRRAARALERHPQDNDRLCCGRSGVIDILLDARDHPVVADATTEVATNLASVLERETRALMEALHARTLELEPAAFEVGAGHLVVGLMRGVCGPLYTASRLVDPSLPSPLPGPVPSVPIQSHRHT